MKDDQGALGWQSQQALASALQDGVDSATVNAALTAWNEGDVYTVARLSCFRDEALGSNMDYTLRTSSDYRWRDSGDLHWATLQRGGAELPHWPDDRAGPDGL